MKLKLKYDKIIYIDYDEKTIEELEKSMCDGNIHSLLMVIMHNQIVTHKRLKEVEKLIKGQECDDCANEENKEAKNFNCPNELCINHINE